VVRTSGTGVGVEVVIAVEVAVEVADPAAGSDEHTDGVGTKRPYGEL
jgi:hypothetical protein